MDYALIKVEDVEDNESNKSDTTVRINANNFWMGGTEEELVYKIPTLMVSVGGFLGLFIGLSLLDVGNICVDFVAKMLGNFKNEI